MSTAHKGAAAALAICVAVLTTPVASADAPPPVPVAVGGDTVTLGTGSDKGPLLGVGMHQAVIPAKSQTNTFRVHREKSETLSVGIAGSYASKSWHGIGSSTDEFTFKYETASGESCNAKDQHPLQIPSATPLGTVTSSFTMGNRATHLAADLGADSPACLAATDFVLTIQRQVSGSEAPDMPTQIDVTRSPQVTAGSTKASVNGLADMSTSALDPTAEAKPGAGWLTATPLTPGGYRLNATPGRAMLFRVHLAWGQRMSVGWQLPDVGQRLPTKQDVRATLYLFNPTLVAADIPDPVRKNTHVFPAGSSDSAELGSYTAPIADGNADLDLSGDQQIIWHQTTPGWYYILAGVGPDPKKASTEAFSETATIPSVLSVRVEGQPQAGPTMAIKQPPAGSISGPSEGSKVSAPVWGGVAALGTLAVAGLAVFLWHRSRTS